MKQFIWRCPCGWFTWGLEQTPDDFTWAAALWFEARVEHHEYEDHGIPRG